MNKTKPEIALEILALKQLKPTGRFRLKTQRSLELIIAELEGKGFDQTADEWNELTDDQRDIIQTTISWMEGQYETKPSDGWEGLCE